MPSQAREDFLSNVAALAVAAQEPNVLAGDTPGSLLRRGLTVTGYNVLEVFIETRLAELASFVNSGMVQFADLTDRMQRQAIMGPIGVTRSRLRWVDKSVVNLRNISRDLGSSLTAVDHDLRLSHLMWIWEGSNMAADDIRAILRLFHVKSPWTEMSTLAGRVGIGTDAKTGLEDLARERNRCAHESNYNVTALWLRSLPSRLCELALLFDAFASVAAQHWRNGSQAFLTDEDHVGADTVQLRFIVDRGADVAEFREGATRAYRVHADRNILFVNASGRCGASELLVRRTQVGEVDRWILPSVG